MADPRFFAVTGPFTVSEIAARTQARIGGAAAPERVLRDVAPLHSAGAEELSFFDNPKYRDAFAKCRAGAVFVHPKMAPVAPSDLCLLLTDRPYRAYAMAAQMFYPEVRRSAGVASTALIDPTARVGEGGRIDHHVVIGARVEIGKRCVVGANSVISEGVVIGDDVRIDDSVSISHAVIGSRVRLFPGVRIGQDGFGFSPDAEGFVKIPQLGRVVIEDGVEIGANSTVDRGAGPDTVIGAGTMIDNLVQIGHNVQIGRNCIFAAQCGVAGSTKIGDFVIVGGQVGFAGHLTIGTGVKVGGKSGVMKDVAEGETVGGTPAAPLREEMRRALVLKRLAEKERVK